VHKWQSISRIMLMRLLVGRASHFVFAVPPHSQQLHRTLDYLVDRIHWNASLWASALYIIRQSEKNIIQAISSSFQILGYELKDRPAYKHSPVHEPPNRLLCVISLSDQCNFTRYCPDVKSTFLCFGPSMHLKWVCMFVQPNFTAKASK
jgi:hypothetical protein